MNAENPNKILLMKIGITVFVIIIIAAWSANLKNVWLFEGRLSETDKSDQDWDKLKTNLEETLLDVRTSLADMQKAVDSKKKEDGAVFLNEVLSEAKNISSSTPDTSASSTDSLLATSSPVLDSVATSSPLNDKAVTPPLSCPEYINCMPSVGEARPCQVPVGCENITLIAY